VLQAIRDRNLPLQKTRVLVAVSGGQVGCSCWWHPPVLQQLQQCPPVALPFAVCWPACCRARVMW
jgi:hypothetical protein